MDGYPQEEPTLDLAEARDAYEAALTRLQNALPQPPAAPVAIDPTEIPWLQVAFKALLLAPLALLRGIVRLVRLVLQEIGEFFRESKTYLIRFSTQQPVELSGPAASFRSQIRMLLLELLWARDHVQEALEKTNGAPYATKRDVLTFVMSNETRLQRVGQLALEIADLDTGDLRDAQPSAPSAERWWWFLNYPRAKRARRFNTLWFVLSLVPALASIVLVTLLAQRLAINGPDLLSGASLIAQVGLGVGSIIAGREILSDLILKGTTASWEGKLTFMLASVFLSVIVVFYFLAPPGAAMIYNLFGQRAIDAGNAAEAELYLESAARLDPDPHAAALLEVGCLYQTLGAPGRAQTVFERVLEADSRLLLARFHLADLYSDESDYDQALQLLEDGLNLLDTGRADIENGDTSFLPRIDTLEEADAVEYLLRLGRGRAYLESEAPEQAKTNLRDAEELYNQIVAGVAEDETETRSPGIIGSRHSVMACGPDDDLTPYIVSTELNLHYYLAR
ncbi:MAG: hypothetical protein JW966_02030, partial [Anaerolineae bacterium]|nr:hypothetical protein [Anaerolineae bacterium]